MSINSMQSQVKKINCYKQNTQNYEFKKNRCRPFCILSFFHIIWSFFNIDLILIDVHYFDAESSKKKSIVTGKMHKITYCLKNRWRPFRNFFHLNSVKFKSTHNIQAYLLAYLDWKTVTQNVDTYKKRLMKWCFPTGFFCRGFRSFFNLNYV